MVNLIRPLHRNGAAVPVRRVGVSLRHSATHACLLRLQCPHAEGGVHLASAGRARVALLALLSAGEYLVRRSASASDFGAWGLLGRAMLLLLTLGGLAPLVRRLLALATVSNAGIFLLFGLVGVVRMRVGCAVTTLQIGLCVQRRLPLFVAGAAVPVAPRHLCQARLTVCHIGRLDAVRLELFDLSGNLWPASDVDRLHRSLTAAHCMVSRALLDVALGRPSS